MSIPALIGVEISEDWNGKMAIVDGKKGLLFIDPDVSTLETYIEERKKDAERRNLLLQLTGRPDDTKDGKHIH